MDKIAQDDIQRHIERILSEEQAQTKFTHPDWEPTPAKRAMLVEMSGKPFIIAATATKLALDLQQTDPQIQLEILCHPHRDTSRAA